LALNRQGVVIFERRAKASLGETRIFGDFRDTRLHEGQSNQGRLNFWGNTARKKMGNLDTA
jgi:hypothetical protein